MNATAYLRRPNLISTNGVLRGLTARAALARAVAERGDRPAAIGERASVSWREVAARTDELARRLLAAGLGEGDVIGVHLPNCWEFVVAHLAIAEIGAVMLPLHMPYRERELETYLAFAEARAAFVPRGASEAKLAAVRSKLPHLAVAVYVDVDAAADAFAVDGATGAAPRSRPKAIEPDHPFFLVPTSGTESLKPKLCMHAHDGLLSNAAAVAESVDVTPGDRLVIGSGYTHLFGLLGVHVALVRGATVLPLPAYSPERFLALAEAGGATMVWAVPSQLCDLVGVRERDSSQTLRLREVRTAGAPIAAELSDRVRATLCDNLVVHWGMSEIGGGITTAGLPLEPKLIGAPVAGAEARVVDADGREAAAGEVGELWYRRADMFRGYFRDPALTKASITPDGWLRTGDLAKRDATGRLWYEGREKDLINRGGFKHSTYEVEAHLGAFAQIREAAIVCVPDERLGEKSCLCVALHACTSLALTEVTALLDARGIAKYKWPEYLIVLDELPSTATGKIWKKALRELASERVLAERVVAVP